MRHKKQTTEEFDQWSAWNQNTYQTGSTTPPKSHGGLIAFLLGLVIFLCGISTSLGLMNIRLFRALNTQIQETTSAAAISYSAPMDEETQELDAIDFALGFSGQTVPEFWNLYQGLPQGVYITHVYHGTAADLQGMLPGDIILKMDDIPIQNVEILMDTLGTHEPGAEVKVTLYRAGAEILLILQLD